MKLKRIAAMTLMAVLAAATLCVSAGAAHYEGTAELLSTIGMFRGTSSGFELDRAPTRSEAAIMLVRLFGAEDEAKAAWEAGEITHPFADVSDFTSPYVAWLYTHGITKGTSPVTYGSQNPCTKNNYLVFLLRVLGYQDGEDFAYADAQSFADEHQVYTGGLSEGTFLRDDLVALTYRALAAGLKDGSTYLLDSLIQSGAVDEEAAFRLKVGTYSVQMFLNNVENISAIGHHFRGLHEEGEDGIVYYFCGEYIEYGENVFPAWLPTWMPDGFIQEEFSAGDGAVYGSWKNDADGASIVYHCRYPMETQFGNGRTYAEGIKNVQHPILHGCETDLYTATRYYPILPNPEQVYTLLAWENEDGILFYIMGDNVAPETIIHFAENLTEQKITPISWRLTWTPDTFTRISSSGSPNTLTQWLADDTDSMMWMYAQSPLPQPDREAVHVTVNGTDALFWKATGETEPPTRQNVGGAIVTSGSPPTMDANVLAWTDDASGTYFQMRASLDQDTMIHIAESAVLVEGGMLTDS